jgi:phosphate transport system substrate-binding protein
MNTRSMLVIAFSYFMLVLAVSACLQPFRVQESEELIDLPSAIDDGFPLIDGSTSTAPLGATIICAMMEVPCQWVDFIDGNKYLLPDLTNYQGDFPGFGHQGTHAAYLNLINGAADLILVAREPSLEELELAQFSGIEFVSQPVALDAFVFIVNENNPVEGLSLNEIQRIYSGELTNWEQVGGPDSEIHPYQRDEQSGSQQLMKSLVMKDLPMIDAPQLILLKMIAPFYAISDDPLGIGYSVYYYEEYMAPKEKVKLLAVDEVKPDRGTIRSRQYPLTTEVYLIVRADLPPTSVAARIRDFMLSPAGQELVEQSGYVRVNE